jgi:hypothetical protein
MSDKLDAVALALAAKSRRNPLPKPLQKKATLELKKGTLVETTKRKDQVYALGWEQDGEVNYFYVGCTVAPNVRLQQHLKAAPTGQEPKYQMWRELESRGQTVTFTVLDAEGEFTEKEWCDILAEQGHLLTNAVEAVDSMRKATSTITKQVIAEQKAAALPQLTPCKGALEALTRVPRKEPL